MKHNLYAIYDTASGIYQRLIPAQSHGQITREFSDLATNAEHPVGAHPEDYTLFYLGTFNDGTGEIIPYAPEALATALEMVSLSRNVNRDNMEALEAKINEQDPDA